VDVEAEPGRSADCGHESFAFGGEPSHGLVAVGEAFDGDGGLRRREPDRTKRHVLLQQRVGNVRRVHVVIE
jgi:hypothetical protein